MDDRFIKYDRKEWEWQKPHIKKLVGHCDAATIEQYVNTLIGMLEGEPEMSCNKIEEGKKYWMIRCGNITESFANKDNAIDEAKKLVNGTSTNTCCTSIVDKCYVYEAIAIVKKPVPEADVVELK